MSILVYNSTAGSSDFLKCLSFICVLKLYYLSNNLELTNNLSFNTFPDINKLFLVPLYNCTIEYFFLI